MLLALIDFAGDRRVQTLGLEIARALRESFSSEKDFLTRRLSARLRARLPELRALRAELLRRAPGLEQFWSVRQPWAMTLAPENLRIMQTTEDTDDGEEEQLALAPVRPSPADLRLPRATSVIPRDAAAGALEVGRLLVDFIQVSGRMNGTVVTIPDVVTSLYSVDTKGIGGTEELLSCELNPDQDKRITFMKALACPLRYGTQGLDALAAAETIALASFVGPFASPSTRWRPVEAEALLSGDDAREALLSGDDGVRTTLFPVPASLAVTSV
jgi:hypothetical protein